MTPVTLPATAPSTLMHTNRCRRTHDGCARHGSADNRRTGCNWGADLRHNRGRSPPTGAEADAEGEVVASRRGSCQDGESSQSEQCGEAHGSIPSCRCEESARTGSGSKGRHTAGHQTDCDERLCMRRRIPPRCAKTAGGDEMVTRPRARRSRVGHLLGAHVTAIVRSVPPRMEVTSPV